MKQCLIVVLLLFSCARQIAPTGGPDDKTPPVIRSTTPQKGTVNFPVKGSVTIAFSEWLDKKTAEKCVSIFPPPNQGVKIKVSGKTMEIKPVQAFSESTTYHIELSMSLTDLHGNSVGTPYHLFFSTGKTIDSGKAFGCVVPAEKPTSPPKVSLFSERTGNFVDSLYLNLPSYVVQTDSFGAFSFEHVRKGRYRIIAFLDANNDNRLQPGKEPTFAPIEKSISLDSAVGPVLLYPVSSDTSTNRIISLKPLTDRILVGSWAQSGDSLVTLALAAWRIQRLDSASASALPLALKEYVPVPQTAKFMLRLSDTMTMAPYLLRYSVPAKFIRDTARFLKDSIRFNGSHQTDTVRPAVQGFSPAISIDLKPRLKLVWSKPVIPAMTAWTMADSLKDTVKLSISRDCSDSTIFTVHRPLKPGRLYRLHLPDTLFSDMSGNHPHDTAFGKYAVQAISVDNICTSLSGSAACLPKNPNRKWLFLPLGASSGFVSGDSSGAFRFDSIAAGKGKIASFLDFNRDGAPTLGSLFPWRSPEPYRLFPDTVEARARWDIEGIEVPEACDECIKNNHAAGKPDSTKKQEKNDLLQKAK